MTQQGHFHGMKRVARGEAGRGSEGGTHTHAPQLVKKKKNSLFLSGLSGALTL